MWIASYNSHVDVVKFLFQHGADPKIPNKQGKLPIDVAKDETIKKLLKGGNTQFVL